MTGRPLAAQVVAASALLAVAVLALAALPSDADEPGSWTALADADVRQEVSYVRVGAKLYLAGGLATQRVYDPASNTWTNAAESPGNLDHIQGVAVGGRIYYVGGLDKDDPAGYPFGEQDSVQIFDPATGEVTDGASLPAGRARGAGAVAVFDGLIYYFGGLSGGTAKRWVDVYDPVEDEWTSLADMPNSRDHSVAVPLGGLIHLIGGRAGTDFATTTGSHRTFNPATGEWVTDGIAPLQTPRGGHAAAVLGGEIIVLGGEGPPVSPPSPAIGRVEAYNPATNSWRDLTAMPSPRHGIQAAVCSGSIYLAGGGATATFDPTDTHDRFSLATPQACTNATPQCASSDLATAPGIPVSAQLNCTDGDGDALAYSIAAPPQHGTIEGPDARGGYTYTPAPGFEGQDGFSVRATDGALSPPAAISILVGDVATVQIAPQSLDFGSLDVSAGPSSPQALTITNTGGAPLSVSGTALAGPDAGEFAIVANGCLGGSLDGGESCEISITFDPVTAGEKSAGLSITDSAPGSPHAAALAGTGTGIPGPLPGRCANLRSGTPRADRITGTRFGDSIRGFGGDDVLRGGAAADCLNGGLGRDELFGGPGADTIKAADGRRDSVHCGPGRDAARADRRDRLAGCERVRPG